MVAKPMQGAQVVSRISAVLKVVGQHVPHGVSSAGVAEQTGLTRPTAHRLLSSLAAEGFIDQDGARTRWHLGPELYLLGSLAARRYNVTDAARGSLRELARLTGESAFFSARRAGETVCTLREEGSFPVRSFVLHEGVRFPLGVASAGLAILSFETDEEIAAYLNTAELVPRWGSEHGTAKIQERIAETRERGYALNPGLILEGSWGMGAAVFDAEGRPEWALSLTGIESRFRAERQPELGRLLVEQAHEVSRKMRSARG